MKRRLAKPIAAAGLLSAFLAVATTVTSPTRVHATCRCGAGDLELVFILDATGSMGPVIGTVKAQAERIIEILESQVESLRVGAVAFRTRDDPEMPRPTVQDLTSDRKRLATWLRTLKASAGGEEAVGDGIDAAINQMSWTPKARKVAILIGDEGPVGVGQTRLLSLAANARSRGIVLHTITQSDTAWLYHLNWLRNTNPSGARSMLERYGSMAKLKKTFSLPIFERIAQTAGGRAVGAGDTREIVKWLLAFALGYDDDDDSPPEVPSAPSSRSASSRSQTKHHGRARIGWVRYNGDWRTPRSFDGLVRHLGTLVRIDLDEKPQTVSLSDRDLWRHPILYLSGHGPVTLTGSERAGLIAYVSSGGMLWADNCCGKQLFESTLKKELSKAFPRNRLARLPRSHPLFDVGHVVGNLRFCSKHRSDRFKSAAPDVSAVTIDGRAAIVYTPHSLGAGWKTYESGMCCLMHDDDALRLSENIILYAFSQ